MLCEKKKLGRKFYEELQKNLLNISSISYIENFMAFEKQCL